MSIEDMQMNNFLQQLYQMSSGDVTAEVSMYDVGASLGLDKSDAGAVAEDLIIDGYAELKNLTGGISITTEGLRMLEVDTAGKTDEQSDGNFVMGNAEVLAPEMIKAVEQVVKDIKKAAAGGDFSYNQVEDIVIDIKTLETQLLSSRPKSAVIREILLSVAGLLVDNESSASLGNQIRKALSAH